MTNTYTINPTINTINSILPGSTVGGTITIGGGGAGTSSASNITLNGGSHIYTTNGTGGIGTNTIGTAGAFTWANSNENVMVVKQSPPELEVKGRMVINGIDLEERLKTIEKVLMIPERDVILEKKYPKLKKLHDQYIAALGKYRTFEAIKGEDE
jgi:hypothetical protein